MKPMTTPELIQWLRDNSSGVYRPAREAADLLVRLHDRNTALIAALRKARNHIDHLAHSSLDVAEHLQEVLHLDSFDVGDKVTAHSPDDDNDMDTVQVTIVGKNTDKYGTPWFEVKPENGDVFEVMPQGILTD